MPWCLIELPTATSDSIAIVRLIGLLTALFSAVFPHCSYLNCRSSSRYLSALASSSSPSWDHLQCQLQCSLLFIRCPVDLFHFSFTVAFSSSLRVNGVIESFSLSVCWIMSPEVLQSNGGRQLAVKVQMLFSLLFSAASNNSHKINGFNYRY